MMRVASTLVESAEYSQTISILQIFDSHGSDNVDAPVIMGKSLYRLGAYLEAIKVCDQAYDKQSKIPSPAAGGYARIGLKRTDLELAHSEKADQTMPNGPYVMNGLTLRKVGGSRRLERDGFVIT